MKIKRLFGVLSTALLCIGAFCATALVDFNTLGNLGKTETIEYKMEENDSCYKEEKIYTGYSSLEDVTQKHPHPSNYYLITYLKGYQGKVLLYVTSFGSNEKNTHVVGISTQIGDKIYDLGKITSDDEYPICKSSGLLYVKNGDIYERYSVSGDGKHIADYGAVKTNTINPKPIVLTNVQKW